MRDNQNWRPEAGDGRLDFRTRNWEHRRCSITVVRRMLDDPNVAPDAEFRRNEEIRGMVSI